MNTNHVYAFFEIQVMCIRFLGHPQYSKINTYMHRIVLTQWFISCFIPYRIFIKGHKSKWVSRLVEPYSVGETTKLWCARLYIIRNLERESPMKRCGGREKGKKPQCWHKACDHPILPLDQSHLSASQREFDKSIYYQISKTANPIHNH